MFIFNIRIYLRIPILAEINVSITQSPLGRQQGVTEWPSKAKKIFMFTRQKEQYHRKSFVQEVKESTL